MATNFDTGNYFKFFCRFLCWRRWFGDENSDGGTRTSDRHTYIGVLRLVIILKWINKRLTCSTLFQFAFADRIDFVLMFSAACLMILNVSLILTNRVIFSRLAGLFTMESFDHSCHHKYPNSNTINVNKYNCPLGIELNSFNSDRLHR